MGTIHLFDPTDSLANDYLIPSVTVQNGLYGLVRISTMVGRATTLSRRVGTPFCCALNTVKAVRGRATLNITALA